MNIPTNQHNPSHVVNISDNAGARLHEQLTALELNFWRELAKTHQSNLDRIGRTIMKGGTIRLVTDGESIVIGPFHASPPSIEPDYEKAAAVCATNAFPGVKTAPMPSASASNGSREIAGILRSHAESASVDAAICPDLIRGAEEIERLAERLEDCLDRLNRFEAIRKDRLARIAGMAGMAGATDSSDA